jgi:hypothetical protein
VLAAQVRAFLQATIKRYKDGDNLLTPKELRDIAGAFSDLSKASGEIYVGVDLGASQPKRKDRPEKAEEISFDITPQDEKSIDPEPVEPKGIVEGHPSPAA